MPDETVIHWFPDVLKTNLLAFFLTFYLAVTTGVVRQRTLTGKSRLGSGKAHWGLHIAIEVCQGILVADVWTWGPGGGLTTRRKKKRGKQDGDNEWLVFLFFPIVLLLLFFITSIRGPYSARSLSCIKRIFHHPWLLH